MISTETHHAIDYCIAIYSPTGIVLVSVQVCFVTPLFHSYPGMSLSDSVPFEVLQQVAEYFDVLAEPMRLRILNLLRGGEKCVQELVDATATSQANVSKHLKVMLQVGILTRRTEGTSAYYSVADDLSFELCTLVCDRLASRIEEQAQHFRAFSLSNGKTE